MQVPLEVSVTGINPEAEVKGGAKKFETLNHLQESTV